MISNDELDIDSGRMEDLEPPVEVPGILTGNPSTIRTAFQHVYGFPVEVDVATGRVFVYAVKDIALSFAARLSQDGHFVTEKLCFDFGRIDETPAIENVVNAWANSSGAVRKIAFFGTDVHHAEGMKEKQFTSIRVDYEHDGELIDLQISREGRISTRSPTVTNGDLKDIFEKLAVALGLGRCSDQIIQDSS